MAGLWSSLFGRGRGDRDPGKYVSAEDFEAKLNRQIEMSPRTVRQLRQYGVKVEDSRPLEYFFYTNSLPKAKSLAAALREQDYQDVETGTSASDSKVYLVTGWSPPVRMHEKDVVVWTEYMVRLGYDHDCEFDGWGTNP